MVAWAGANLLIVKSDLPVADAIVVLSGSSTYIERAAWAARQYRAGRAPVVILTDDKLISGWNKAEERNPYFYELAARELQNRGVPGERILVISEAALGTYDESLNICEFARAHRLGKLLIVTSGYHSRRALWSIRHACPGYELETGVDGPSGMADAFALVVLVAPLGLESGRRRIREDGLLLAAVLVLPAKEPRLRF